MVARVLARPPDPAGRLEQQLPALRREPEHGRSPGPEPPLRRRGEQRLPRPRAPVAANRKTTGIVRCDQPRALDLGARRAKMLEHVPDAIMDEVLSTLTPNFEWGKMRSHSSAACPRPAVSCGCEASAHLDSPCRTGEGVCGPLDR
jgi:hypothetical protein